uniref:Uncharacterized protein n=1 Tax=Micrurus spixii TaxID=129469 RepID=A0A2D4M2V6_9SAUR
MRKENLLLSVFHRRECQRNYHGWRTLHLEYSVQEDLTNYSFSNHLKLQQRWVGNLLRAMSAFMTFAVSLSHMITVTFSTSCPLLARFSFPPLQSRERDYKRLSKHIRRNTVYQWFTLKVAGVLLSCKLSQD